MPTYKVPPPTCWYTQGNIECNSMYVLADLSQSILPKGHDTPTSIVHNHTILSSISRCCMVHRPCVRHKNRLHFLLTLQFLTTFLLFAMMINTELALTVLFTLSSLTLSLVAARISGRELSKSVDQTLLSFLDDSSFARDLVVNMMVTEYTTTSYPNIDDRLDNAIEAIQICETDGEPIQVKGHDFLYVGSVGEF